MTEDERNYLTAVGQGLALLLRTNHSLYASDIATALAAGIPEQRTGSQGRKHMTDTELIEETRNVAERSGWKDLFDALADALAAHQWQPIETATLVPKQEIEVMWWDDGPDDVALVILQQLPGAWDPGKKAWLNTGSGNYGQPRQRHQWPSYWRLLVPPETKS